MAPHFRHRAAVLAVFAAAPALGVVILAAGPAQAAARTTESGRQVVFSGGGLLGLSCTARPDVRSITVRADTSLRVVNDTGHRAKLLLDDAIQGELQDSASVDVLFRRGPVTLTLKPSCVLSEESNTVRVSVETPAAVPDQQAAPPAPFLDPQPSASAGQGGLPDSGGGRDHRRGPGLPTRSSAGGGLPDGGARAGGGPFVVQPGEADGSGRRVALPGMPPGEDPRLAPGASAVDLPPEPEIPADAVAAEPVAALEPITANGPTGLLAIIATICAAGVTAGLIRAIAAQRALRIKVV